jgi:hypothetical protein
LLDVLNDFFDAALYTNGGVCSASVARFAGFDC